jgi:putative phosphoesterase
MKILALYDIHGNPDALEAVLGDPRAEGADVIVVGGDVVPGARAREALDRLNGVAVPLQWVRGNGEREVATAVAREAGLASGAEGPALSTAAVTAAELGKARARALDELPLTVTIDGVLLCHASPRRDDEMLTRLSPPERWAKALAGVDAALIVGGHTHQQDDRVVGGIRFINSGSIGLPCPDALEHLFAAIRGTMQPRGRLIVVFGRGGSPLRTSRRWAGSWPRAATD